MLRFAPVIAPDKPFPAAHVADTLRAALAESDRMAAVGTTALSHALAARQVPDFVNDGVVAHVSAMMASVASQLSEVGSLAEALAGNAALVQHCHELALEWRLAMRLQEDLGLDPVLSPLFLEVAGMGDEVIGPLATAALAAQARFAQHRRRMELPLLELPAELFAELLALAEAQSGPTDYVERTRASHDERATRLALLGRLAHELGEAGACRDVAQAGVAVWLSALSERSGQARGLVVESTALPTCERIALTLRATGLSPDDIGGQLLHLRMVGELPADLETLSPALAASLLAGERE